jgi:hypothetical protein
MNVKIKFAWRRSLDYELVEDASLQPGGSLLDTPTTGTRIIAKGATADRYEPQPDLWRRFAQIKNRKQAENFVRTWGPLTREGLGPKGERVEHIVYEAEQMRNEAVGAWALSKLTARLLRGRLEIEPNSLLDALWLQYADAKSKGGASRCLRCNDLFHSGPGGRGRNAKFCSDECRIKYYSDARSQR